MGASRRTSLRPCDRVLVVNDDAAVLQSMRDVLESAGATVQTAGWSREAERILESDFNPDAIVVDLRLGDGRPGDLYARRLRANPRYEGIPILLMSADRHELKRVGAAGDAALAKPFSLDRLYQILSKLCSERRAEDFDDSDDGGRIA